MNCYVVQLNDGYDDSCPCVFLDESKAISYIEQMRIQGFTCSYTKSIIRYVPEPCVYPYVAATVIFDTKGGSYSGVYRKPSKTKMKTIVNTRCMNYPQGYTSVTTWIPTDKFKTCESFTKKTLELCSEIYRKHKEQEDI